jgi:heme oxygenase
MPVADSSAMHGASKILQQLEYAARVHHVAVDPARVSLLAPNVCRETYVAYLARVYAFEAPVEARWRTTARLESVIDLPRPLHTELLASDLRALGCTLEAVEPASFVGLEQALGWMYVVERGRRLNAMLRRHLLRRLPDEIEIAGSYLAVSSPSGMRWQRFAVALGRLARNRATAEQILNAAHRAFRALRATRSPLRGNARAA